MELKPLPDAEKIVFKDDFITRYSAITDWEEFKKYSLSYLRKAVRINTIKTTIEECRKSLEKKGWKLKQIPWCTEGFWIEHETRRDIGNTWEHHMGHIYVQEAASMIPPIVLNPQPHESVLDLSAAPGSKATQMAAMMSNTGILVANDHKAIRLASLGINVQRVGAANVIITLMRGQGMRRVQFDRILVDAPCSGTGTICKSLKTIDMWNPSMITRLSGQQIDLLTNAWKLLKPGGILVYSTCTLEPEEDEGTISTFLKATKNATLEEIREDELPDLKRSKAVTEFNGQKYLPEVKHCLRIWPQDNGTEGFFVARMKKE